MYACVYIIFVLLFKFTYTILNIYKVTNLIIFKK